MTWMLIFKWAAALSSGLFSGAALYVTFVEHPARMECGSSLAVTEFAPSYRRGAAMQGGLAVLGLLASLLAGASGAGWPWILGGALLGLAVPFTLFVIFPINKQLLDPSLGKNSEKASSLLKSWGRLHAVRSALGTASFFTFLWLLLL